MLLEQMNLGFCLFQSRVMLHESYVKKCISKFLSSTQTIYGHRSCSLSISYSNILTNNNELLLIALEYYYKKSNGRSYLECYN